MFKKNRGRMFQQKPIKVLLTDCKKFIRISLKKMGMNSLKPNSSSFPKTA